MKDKTELNIEPVFAKGFDWQIIDYYVAGLRLKSFGEAVICLSSTGQTQQEAVEKIVVILDYEIEELINTRDEIKRMYKL